MLTIEDRIAIQDLYTRYCLAIDTDDADVWADTYTTDCRFIRPVGDVEQTIEGRAAIHAFARDQVAGRDSLPYRHRQHWTSNLLVEGDGTDAKGFCYLVGFAEDKATGDVRIITFGYYQDRLRKVDSVWQFSERRLVKGRPLPPGLSMLFA